MKAFIVVLALSLSAFSTPSVAQIDSLSKAINESGRLRMLSQRMAKAYLLQVMDIQPEKAKQQFTTSLKKFETNLSDLNQFSDTLGSPVNIQISLQAIMQQWLSYQAELNKAPDQFSIKKLLALSDKTLMACEVLVNELEKIAQRDSARWVNLSGRQRMLSQRIAKFYTAISLSGGTPHYVNGLQQSIDEFDNALIALMASPDNTHFVNHKLKRVATQWNFSKQGFRVLGSGNSTPLVISMTSESILKQMNDITALYEAIDNRQKRLAFK